MLQWQWIRGRGWLAAFWLIGSWAGCTDGSGLDGERAVPGIYEGEEESPWQLWHHDTIAQPVHRSGLDLVDDRADTLHLVFSAPLPDTLLRAIHYAYKAEGEPWQIEEVPTIGHCMNSPALAIDRTGRVHIVYGSNTSLACEQDEYTLNYAERTPAGEWSAGMILDGKALRGTDYIVDIDLVADRDDRLHAVFYARSHDGVGLPGQAAADYKPAYAHRDDHGQWRVEPISEIPRGRAMSLATDTAGVLHMSYLGTADHALYLANRQPSGLWSASVVDQSDYQGIYRSAIAVDQDGGVAIAADSLGQDGIKFAHRPGADQSWNVFDAPAGGAFYGGLAVDDELAVHLVARGWYDGSCCVVRHAYRQDEDSPWLVTIVQDAGEIGEDAKIVVTSTGEAHIVHYNRVTDQLQHTYSTLPVPAR